MPTAATRYASRTLAYLRVTEDGSYLEYAPSFDMPEDAYEILKRVDDASPSPLGTDLNIIQPFADKFFGQLSDAWFGHGNDIHTFLAEKVPDAQFVVSEDQLDFPVPCGLLSADTAASEWPKVEERFAAMRNTIAEAITEYGINFVHLSWGPTHDTMARAIESECGSAPSREVTARILEMYAELFRAIASLESPGAGGVAQPVLMFQAGAVASPEEDYLLDCADIPGRIRVSSVPYGGSEVPSGGTHDYSLLWESLRPGMPCNDVYMVMGYTDMFGEHRDEYFECLALGLGAASRPSWPPETSFANPIALAHFIYLAQQNPLESVASWEDLLTASWTKPILDPLLYNQFPARERACGAAP